MTLAAILLRDRFFQHGLSTRLKYATLGVLLVNISIGGTLTPFAAPPVLMVAGTWGWDLSFMMWAFGWKAVIAVLVNALILTTLFRKELRTLSSEVKSTSSCEASNQHYCSPCIAANWGRCVCSSSEDVSGDYSCYSLV